MTVRLRSGLCVLAGLAAAAGCREAGPAAEITARRTASRPSSAVVPGATASQRFGRKPEESRQASDDLENLIAYDLPGGWMAIAPTSDRLVNLRPAGDPEASCYLSFLQGSAGGLEANVNRWRAQLGAGPLTGDEVAALPRVTMLGRPAALVEVEGSFSGMGGGPARPGFKLLGLVVSEPAGSLFLKFTAPAGVVELERENFLAFARSLRLAGHGDDPHEGEGHDHTDGDEGAGAGGEESPVAVPGGAAHERAFTWSVPPGWNVQPPRTMREVTFALAGGGECYVTRLPGDAGGLRANLDRWSDQFGGQALSEDAFAALERVDVLGQRVPVLELEGPFTGMDGVTREQHGLLGVVCIRGEDSVFVKLTGPEAVVRAERANFLAFVRSLEEAS
jgi:hypothetical protein